MGVKGAGNTTEANVRKYGSDKPIRTRNAANRKGRKHKDYPVALQAHVHALDEADAGRRPAIRAASLSRGRH
jgi:hypothetical protein